MKSILLVHLLLLSCYADNAGIKISYPDGNQLLFYPKNQLVNRLSFAHVFWTMDLQGPLDLLKSVTAELEARSKVELRKYSRPIKQFDLEFNVSSVWSDNTLQELYSERHLDGAVVTLTLLEMFYRIYHQLDSLLRSVPENYNVNEDVLVHQRSRRATLEDSFSFTDNPWELRCLNSNFSSDRTKREVIGGLALGLGLWNSYRISTIESHFANMSSKYNTLVDSVSLLSSQHNQLAADVELMKRLIHIISSNNYRKILATSISTSDHLRDTVDTVVEIITSGRQRRISPKLINGDDLVKLFLSLKKKAAELDSELLLSHPTDIYEVQASYGYSQSGLFFKIYAHVPMASKSETLSLFEHIQFPLVYQSMATNLTITPDTGLDRFLAVLPTETSPDGHKYRVLDEPSLQNCFKLRGYYLCSGRNTLRLDIKSSCIGSLWMQDHDLIVKNCNMKVEPLQEVVVKIAPRQWLVFSPTVLIRSVKCGKNVVQSLRFEHQTSVTLVEDCEVPLSRFILSSDSNLLMDFKVQTHEWRYFGNIFSPTTLIDDDLNKAIDKISMTKGKYGLPNLSDLKYHYEVSGDHLSKVWKAISNLNLFSWFGNVYMFILYVVIIWVCYIVISKGWLKKCCCFKKKIPISRSDSSIIRPIRTPSVRYTVPSQSSSPPPYNSVVEENPSAPIVFVDNETSSDTSPLYPSLESVESEPSQQCFIKYSSKNKSLENFVCHHHDPIHGCNGTFDRKSKSKKSSK